VADESTYDKVFLPGLEREHATSGRDDRLLIDARHGRFGFTACYDHLFNALLREHAMVDECGGLQGDLPAAGAVAGLQPTGGLRAERRGW